MINLAKIKDLREKLGLSMDAAAKAAGFSNRQQWFLIESGQRADVQVSTLEKIATALKCKPKDLLK